MDLKILLSWLALNVGLLAAIVLIIVGWKRTRALTGPELAKKLDKVTDADPQKPDFTLGEIAFLLRETGRPRGAAAGCGVHLLAGGRADPL
jgi:hypothetical protein